MTCFCQHFAVCYIGLWRVHLIKNSEIFDTNISQGKVATRLGCGWIFNEHFFANFSLSVPMKEFTKSVDIFGGHGKQLVAWWCNGRVSYAWPTGRWFNSRPFYCHITTLRSCSHTLRASVTKQCNLVPAKRRWCSAAGKVTEASRTVTQARVYGFVIPIPLGAYCLQTVMTSGRTLVSIMGLILRYLSS